MLEIFYCSFLREQGLYRVISLSFAGIEILSVYKFGSKVLLHFTAFPHH